MDNPNRQACEYAEKCYRLNPNHLQYKEHKHLEILLPQFIQNPKRFSLPDSFTMQYPNADSKQVIQQLAVLQSIFVPHSSRSSGGACGGSTGPSTSNVQTSPPSTSSTVSKPESSIQKSKKSSSKESDQTLKVIKQLLEAHTCISVEEDNDNSCSICHSKHSPYIDESSDEDDECLLELDVCQDVFHRACLMAMIQSSGINEPTYIKCPNCCMVYGTRIGNQPEGGTMTFKKITSSLAGYDDCGSIEIIYDFPKNGLQGSEHPNPGQPFKVISFPRKAYLPDNENGNHVLSLLQLAFKRRLIFTIGSSRTNGMDDVVTWNDIHHKTKTSGQYGYPDPEYLGRVIEELEGVGVNDESLSEEND